MPFSTVVVDTFVRAVTERVASAGLSGLVAGFKRARVSRSDEPDDSGASTEERVATYDAFQEAVVRHRTTLALLASGTPTVSGAIWTFPVHIRALNRAPDEAARLVDTFLSVEMKGGRDAIVAAEEALAAMVEATKAFVPERRRERSARERGINAALSLVDEAVIRFVSTAREELGYSGPRGGTS